MRLCRDGEVDPLADAIATFKVFLERSGNTFIIKALDEAEQWDFFKDEAYNNEAFTTIVAAICTNTPDIVSEGCYLLFQFWDVDFDCMK